MRRIHAVPGTEHPLIKWRQSFINELAVEAQVWSLAEASVLEFMPRDSCLASPGIPAAGFRGGRSGSLPGKLDRAVGGRSSLC